VEKIIKGVCRFRTEVFPAKRALFQELAKGQNPSAVVISCADSRVDMQMVTQSEPGEIFCFRNAGNIVPPYGAVLGAASATIEYAMEALEIPHIIVCGHSDCGAMKGVLKHDLAARMPTVAGWLRFAEVPRQLALQKQHASEQALLDALVRENVLAQLAHLRTHPAVAVRLARGAVTAGCTTSRPARSRRMTERAGASFSSRRTRSLMRLPSHASISTRRQHNATHE
jgi:carbonic anhydrase